MAKPGFLLQLLLAVSLGAGVPTGTVTKFTWTSSKVYPGSTHTYWVYVPAQYDSAKPACLMVFLDGSGFVTQTGPWRVPIVFDNLIRQKAMPVTVGVFVDPGINPADSPAAQQDRFNRSYEYDSLGPRYASFLLDEILPEVQRHYNISADPNDRGIAGSGSGGIAAFTAAWERPDSFHRTMSFTGSYGDVKGGDFYPGMIRRMEPKPLRIFLQDGAANQNTFSGNQRLENQSIASALEYAGYDVKFVVGREGHNSSHAAAILPDALRWLWRGYPRPIADGPGAQGQRLYISGILDPAHDWELVGQGYGSTDGPAVDKDGNVYFTDARASRIYKVGADGKPVVFMENSGGAGGLMFGRDGRLYAGQLRAQKTVAYSPDGTVSVLQQGAAVNDLAVTPEGAVYFTDSPEGRRILRIDPQGGGAKVVFDGAKDGNIEFPNGIRLSPDHSLLVVTDWQRQNSWSFRIQADGSLGAAEPFYRLEMPEDTAQKILRSGADGFTFDDQGFAYITTYLGVQICDPLGRVVGIIRTPGNQFVTGAVFGGPDMRTLYVTARDKVWRRQLRRKGVLPWQSVKPPKPVF
ncbi:MAG TPA: SMP-30/gluconolactonase/LRE family protein [Bryobacteraceae bacterium]|nr:SMP-30/gluconolactonase/LRE family protein [Bryobacteraceae bacterium]